MGNVCSGNKRWPRGEVPFTIDESSLNNNPGNPNIDVRRGIDDAINEWNKPENRLMVRLVPRTDQSNYDKRWSNE